MLSQLLTLVGALSGVSLGWGLNQYTLWRRDRKDSNKVRNEVLFYLLEFRHTLIGLNIDTIVRLIKEKLYHSFPQIQNSNEFDTILQSTIQPIALSIIKQNIDNKLPYIRDGFSLAVNNLSSVDPILAFELAGQDQLITYGDEISKEIQKAIPADQKPQLSSINDTLTILNKLSIEKAEKIFDDLIEQVAEKISLKARKEVKAKIAFMKNKLSSENQEINEFLKNMCTELT